MVFNIIKINEKINNLFFRCYTKLARHLFAQFGTGSTLCYPSRIHNPQNIFIGNHVLIQPHVWLNPLTSWMNDTYNGKIYIHDNTVIMNEVQISAAARITIGKYVGIGRNSTIIDHHHDYTVVDMPIMRSPLTKPAPVVIEDEVFIGVNCLIAPGVTIGRHSFIAANSTVTRSIPAYSFAAGAPATVVRTYNHAQKVWEKCQTIQR